jgi:hypothetical protein
MTYSILEWINSDEEEGSKIKFVLDMPGGSFCTNIHLSSMSDGTNERGPYGCHVAMRWKW